DADASVRAKRQALMKQKQLLDAGPAAVAKLLDDPAIAAQVAAWEQSAKTAAVWKTLDPASVASTDGSTLTKQPDGSILSGGKRPERDTYTIEADFQGEPITAIRLEVLSDPSLPKSGPGRQDNGNLHLSEFRIEVGPNTARRPV